MNTTPKTADTTTTETTTEWVKVGVRIGRGGTKCHRAFATRIESAPGKPWNRTRFVRLMFACSCPGCCNGHANHKASIVSTDDWNACNCEN